MSRFTKLSPEGTALPDDATADQVAGVRINATGIVVMARLLADGKTVTYAEAVELGNSAGAGIAGLPCRAPTIEEIFTICDRTKFEPALDPTFWGFLVDGYETDQEGYWRVWAAQKDAEFPESYAWLLDLGDGDASIGGQGGRGFALAVCGPAPSPGQ